MRNSSWPIFPGSRLAPITAIDRGASSRAIDADSAWLSRASTTPTDVVVGAIANRTRTVPWSNWLSASQPASENTLSIFEFPGSVSAEERRDAVRARDAGEVLEQQRGEAAPLLVVGDRERDLGLVGRDAVVARDRDDVVAELGDQHHVVDVVDRRDPLELHRGRARHRREEPEVDRLVAQPLVQREQRGLVVGPARAGPAPSRRRRGRRRSPTGPDTRTRRNVTAYGDRKTPAATSSTSNCGARYLEYVPVRCDGSRFTIIPSTTASHTGRDGHANRSGSIEKTVVPFA